MYCNLHLIDQLILIVAFEHLAFDLLIEGKPERVCRELWGTLNDGKTEALGNLTNFIKRNR